MSFVFAIIGGLTVACIFNVALSTIAKNAQGHH